MLLAIDPGAGRNLGIAAINKKIIPNTIVYNDLLDLFNLLEPFIIDSDEVVVERSYGFGWQKAREKMFECQGIIKLLCLKHNKAFNEISPTEVNKIIFKKSIKNRKSEIRQYVNMIMGTNYKCKEQHLCDAIITGIAFLEK